MCLEDLAANIDQMTVGLDDTFQFRCTQCGLCCLNREDILLSPMDMFRISKELKLPPAKFFAQYCEAYIGDNTRIPIVRLQPLGEERRCPLLKNHKCSVHKVKPSVCGMFPLGRYIAIEKDDYSAEGVGKSEVKYLMQPIECGDTSQTHTVREWLADFDIKLEDEAFIRWHQTIAKVSTKIRELEKIWDMVTMMEVWFMIRAFLYERYDTEEAFMPQFEENASIVTNMLEDIPRLKELMRNVRRP